MDANDVNHMLKKLMVPRPEDKKANVLARASSFRNQLSHHQSLHAYTRSTTRAETLPEGHPAVTQDAKEQMRCPFTSLAAFGSTDKQRNKSDISQTSLPTPPETTRHLEGEDLEYLSDHKSPSPPPSITGLTSKCPIRMLDERPAEEIAEYFESHKHEIPRSHEICVKRYQSNAQSIRQLDAKYGNLANMIQGLGMKHQPMLPGKEVDKAMKAQSMLDDPIEAWAHHVPTVSDEQNLSASRQADNHEREGHFDRPMRDVRVGESPSRPWGVRVPEELLGESADSHIVHTGASNPEQQPMSIHSKPSPEPSPWEQIDPSKKNSSQMIFTGPVFIGYPPDQAAALLAQLKTSNQANP